jgi:hypothetical protein
VRVFKCVSVVPTMITIDFHISIDRRMAVKCTFAVAVHRVRCIEPRSLHAHPSKS